MKKTLLLINLILLSFILASCDFLGLKKYRITYYVDNEIYLQEEKKSGILLEKPDNPNKFGFDFDNWYMDIEDKNTKWNFETYKVTGHLALHALFIPGKIALEEVKIENNIISWKNIENGSYNIKFLDIKDTITTNSFDLSIYLDKLTSTQIFTITPVLNDIEGLTTYIKLTLSSLDSNVFNITFDNLSKGGYEIADIEDQGYSFEADDALIGSSESDLITGAKSLRIKENGYIRMNDYLDNFDSLSFNAKTYGSDQSSNLDIYYSLSDSEYTLLKTVSIDNNIKNIIIEKSEITNLKESDKISFMIKKDSKTGRINIDDLTFLKHSEPKLEYEIYKEGESNIDVELPPYYKSIEGLGGKALVDELRIIISTNLKGVSYGEARYLLQKADVHPDDSNYVLAMYSQEKILAEWDGKRWTREHVWPRSRLGTGKKDINNSDIDQASDPHNLRAINQSVNSSRGNRYFEVAISGDKNQTVGSNGYFPGVVDKGDVARIFMYMVVRYDFLNLTNNKTLLTKTTTYQKSGAYMGLLSVLDDWHLEDPVSDFEINRNEEIYKAQNNRNPFIDVPELFLEVYNYFVTLDEERERLLSINYTYEIDYGYFISNKLDGSKKQEESF